MKGSSYVKYKQRQKKYTHKHYLLGEFNMSAVHPASISKPSATFEEIKPKLSTLHQQKFDDIVNSIAVYIPMYEIGNVRECLETIISERSRKKVETAVVKINRFASLAKR